MSAALVLSGTLAEHAQHRRRRDGMSVLVFDVDMPSSAPAKPLTCRVIQEYGTGNAAAVACGNRAHHLRRGVRVVVHANACDKRAARIELSRVERVEARELDLAHAERYR